jgi:hypothetical protein
MDPLAQPVEVRVFSSDDELNSAMQKKLEAVYAEILAGGAVAAAQEAYEAAQRDVAKLKKSQARLTERGREIFGRMGQVCDSIETGLIESETSGIPAELKKLDALQGEHNAVLRANSRILEHLLPRAEIAELRRAAESLSIKAQAVREAAAQRIEKTARMMAEAAEFEGGIVFDSMNTLSGEMQRQAAEFERQAANYLEWARQREEQYLRVAKGLQSIGR